MRYFLELKISSDLSLSSDCHNSLLCARYKRPLQPCLLKIWHQFNFSQSHTHCLDLHLLTYPWLTENESAKCLNRISAKDSGTLCYNCTRNTWNRNLDATAGQVQFGDELIKQNWLVLAGKEGRKEVFFIQDKKKTANSVNIRCYNVNMKCKV